MVQINFALREVNCKIVYYGPGLSGKTTNIEVVHLKAPEANKGELTSIATEGDRTLFFDYMPLDLGNIAGMKTKFQLYTVPGQVYYNSTRKLVLQGVDGIIFVADSQADKLEENLESLENLRANLIEAGKDIDQIAMLIQYNKRDLPGVLDIETLNKHLNPRNPPTFEAVAVTGEGVFPTLKALSSVVLENLSKQRSSVGSRAVAQKAPAPVAVAAAGHAPSNAAAASAQVVPAPAAPPVAPLPPQPESLPPTPTTITPTTITPPTSPALEPSRPEAPAEHVAATRTPKVSRPGKAKRKGPSAKKKRKTPRAGPVPVARTSQVQIQKISIENHKGKILTLIALGIVVTGALGFILNSFGVL